MRSAAATRLSPPPGQRTSGSFDQAHVRYSASGPPSNAAEADLVETRQDEARHVAAAERELERLLRAGEARRDAELDRLVRERLAERERLLDAELGEALAGRQRADAVVRVRAGVRVAHEQQASQNSTLR